jgi:hypothetical protein
MRLRKRKREVMRFNIQLQGNTNKIGHDRYLKADQQEPVCRGILARHLSRGIQFWEERGLVE